MNRFIIANSVATATLTAELAIGTVTGDEAIYILNRVFDPSRPIPVDGYRVVPNEEYVSLDEINDVRRSLEYAEREQSESEERVEELEAELSDARDKCDELSERVDDLESEVLDLKSQIADLTAEINTLESEKK